MAPFSNGPVMMALLILAAAAEELLRGLLKLATALVALAARVLLLFVAHDNKENNYGNLYS